VFDEYLISIFFCFGSLLEANHKRGHRRLLHSFFFLNKIKALSSDEKTFFNTKTLEKVGCRILTKTHIYYIINKFTKLSVSKKLPLFLKKK